MHVESKLREPLITGGKNLHDISRDVSRRVEEKPSLSWFAALSVALLMLSLGGKSSIFHAFVMISCVIWVYMLFIELYGMVLECGD